MLRAIMLPGGKFFRVYWLQSVPEQKPSDEEPQPYRVWFGDEPGQTTDRHQIEVHFYPKNGLLHLQPELNTTWLSDRASLNNPLDNPTGLDVEDLEIV